MVPDYEPELDDLQIRLASAQAKMPNKPTVRQIEEKTEEKIDQFKRLNWKLIGIILLVLMGIAVFALSYHSVLRKQEPGAMQQIEDYPQTSSPAVRIAKPEFSLFGGEYSYYIDVEIFSETEGTIYYTLDGSTPNETSYTYEVPIDLQKGTTVIRAFVIDSDGNTSDIASEVYHVEFGAPDKPTIIPESGEYTGEQYVRIIVPEGCMAFYTLDGSMPTHSSELYTGEFLMPAGTTTVKAVLEDENGMISETSMVVYTCMDAGQ